MKKTLRIAALLGASLVALNAAAEGAAGQGPVLSFGGSITAGAAGINQKVRLHGNPPAVRFLSKGNLVMNVGGTATNGTGYGAVGILDFDRAKTLENRIGEAYIYANHDCIGNIKIGDTEGIVNTMMYSGDDVLGGLGGTSGDLEKLINLTRTVSTRPGIAPVNNKSTKLVWVSPEVHGFQVGVDFTPSTKLHGRVTGGSEFTSTGTVVKNSSTAPYSTNLLAGGLSYNKAFSNFNLGLYLVGHTGNSRNDTTGTPTPPANKFKHTTGYQIGALVDYQNWQLAGSWFDNGKSLVQISTDASLVGNTNTKGVNAAIGYDFARNANVAVGYTHTYRKVRGGDAKADVAMLTLDYVVAPGWVAFAEVDHFKLKAPSAAIATATGPATTGVAIYADRDGLNANNHGTAFILGTKLRF